MQNELAANPDAGAVIPGLDGLRKIRLALLGRRTPCGAALRLLEIASANPNVLASSLQS